MVVVSTLQLRNAAADQYQFPYTFVQNIDGSKVNPSDECEWLGYGAQVKYDVEGSGAWEASGSGSLADLAALGILADYDMDAGILYSWSTVLPIDAVVIKGAQFANAYIYDPEATGGGSISAGEDGPGDMVAPENSSGGAAGISHISFCYDRELSLSKTAEGAYDLDYDWSVTKTADQLLPFVGEDVNYTVTVTNTDETYSNLVVSGFISATNLWNVPSPAMTATDTVMYGTGTYTVSGINIPSIAPGETEDVFYSVNLTGVTGSTAPTGGDNQVVAVSTDAGWNNSDPFTTAVSGWSPALVTDPTVTVNDSFGEGPQNVVVGFADSPKVFNYSKSFSTTGDHTNTVDITVDSDDPSDNSASVTVTAYDISVSKDAAASYTRDYDWKVEKSALPLDPFVGESVSYTVTVTNTGFDDYGHTASGGITVINNHPSRSATVAISDQNEDVELGDTSLTVPADNDLTPEAENVVSTTWSLATDQDGSNVATGTLYDIDYDSDPATWAFGDPTTLIDETVKVTDFYSEGPQNVEVGLGDSGVFNYSKIFGTTGTHTNTVNITVDSDDPSDNSASVTVTAFNISVSKTAGTSFTRDYDWTISKSVAEGDLNVFENEEVNYTISAGLTGSSDSDYTVSGAITVINNHPDRSIDVSLLDTLSSGETAYNATVEVPSGTHSYAYSQAVDDASSGTNTVVWSANTLLSGQDDEAYSFDLNAPSNEIDRTAVVSDLMFGGTLATLDAVTGQDSYSDTFTNSFSAGSHDNTACIDGSGDAANNGANAEQHCQTVTVNVHDLEVTKTVDPAFDRSWNWAVQKTATWDDGTNSEADVPNPVNLTIGGSITIDYSIAIYTTGYVDDNYRVSGAITIVNTNPVDSAVVTVSDVLSGGLANATATLDAAGPWTIAPSGNVVIGYSALGLDAGHNLNTVTVNDSFKTYTTPVPFNFTPSELLGDAAVTGYNLTPTVTDQFEDNDVQTLTVAPANKLTGSPVQTLDGGSQDILHENICGPTSYTNVANLLTGDQDLDSSVVVNVLETCGLVLTRTPGYWKTHSNNHQGGAVEDPTWYWLGDVDGDGVEERSVELFLSPPLTHDLTWYDALSQPDSGSPWNTLARHYAAAYMNVLAGAPDDDLGGPGHDGINLDDGDLQDIDVLATAYLYLTDADSLTVTNNTGLPNLNPATNAPWTRKELRDQEIKGKVVSEYLNSFAPMLLLAEYLDAYNNGIAWDGLEPDNQVGPGHAHG